MQGSQYHYSDIQGFLDTLETLAPNGGLEITAIYRPWCKENRDPTITDEQFDFSAQTMSLIGNNYQGNAKDGLHWEYNDWQEENLLWSRI